MTPIESTPVAGMTEIDLADDDALRFVQRVLESDAPAQDRQAARDMVVAIRTRVRKSALASSPAPAEAAVVSQQLTTREPPPEPYLCIEPACGPDCCGCNCAISPAAARKDAVRYRAIRDNDIPDAEPFYGGEALDERIDSWIAAQRKDSA